MDTNKPLRDVAILFGVGIEKDLTPFDQEANDKMKPLRDLAIALGTGPEIEKYLTPISDKVKTDI